MAVYFFFPGPYKGDQVSISLILCHRRSDRSLLPARFGPLSSVVALLYLAPVGTLIKDIARTRLSKHFCARAKGKSSDTRVLHKRNYFGIPLRIDSPPRYCLVVVCIGGRHDTPLRNQTPPRYRGLQQIILGRISLTRTRRPSNYLGHRRAFELQRESRSNSRLSEPH